MQRSATRVLSSRNACFACPLAVRGAPGAAVDATRSADVVAPILERVDRVVDVRAAVVVEVGNHECLAVATQVEREEIAVLAIRVAAEVAEQPQHRRHRRGVALRIADHVGQAVAVDVDDAHVADSIRGREQRRKAARTHVRRRSRGAHRVAHADQSRQPVGVDRDGGTERDHVVDRAEAQVLRMAATAGQRRKNERGKRARNVSVDHLHSNATFDPVGTRHHRRAREHRGAVHEPDRALAGDRMPPREVVAVVAVRVDDVDHRPVAVGVDRGRGNGGRAAHQPHRGGATRGVAPDEAGACVAEVADVRHRPRGIRKQRRAGGTLRPVHQPHRGGAGRGVAPHEIAAAVVVEVERVRRHPARCGQHDGAVLHLRPVHQPDGRGLRRRVAPKQVDLAVAVEVGGDRDQPRWVGEQRRAGGVHEPVHQPERGRAGRVVAPDQVVLAVAVEVGDVRHAPRGGGHDGGPGRELGAVHEPDRGRAGGVVAPDEVGPAVAVEIAEVRDAPVRIGHELRAARSAPCRS